MKRKIEVKIGEIYFVPLFLGHDFSMKSYSRYKFGEAEQKFCFARVIKDLEGMGTLIEVFDLVGNLETELVKIQNSSRLFDPVLVAGDGIQKKRWRKVGQTENYDPEAHSRFSEIQLLVGDMEYPDIWKNHATRKPDREDLSSIERATIMTAWQLETKVCEKLNQ